MVIFTDKYVPISAGYFLKTISQIVTVGSKIQKPLKILIFKATMSFRQTVPTILSQAVCDRAQFLITLIIRYYCGFFLICTNLRRSKWILTPVVNLSFFEFLVSLKVFSHDCQPCVVHLWMTDLLFKTTEASPKFRDVQILNSWAHISSPPGMPPCFVQALDQWFSALTTHYNNQGSFKNIKAWDLSPELFI